MDEAEYARIPGEDVLSHVAYEAYGEVPYGWHVFVLKDMDAMRLLRGQYDAELLDHQDAYAWTVLRNEPHAGNFIGEMYFVEGYVYVGLIAHESVHMASWILGLEGVKKMRAGAEPERLAELVAQLTSVVWYNLEDWWTQDA